MSGEGRPAKTVLAAPGLGPFQGEQTRQLVEQNARPRYAIHTAARCGASIRKSEATGITAEGMSKIRKNPSNPAAHCPSRSDHKSRAKRKAIPRGPSVTVASTWNAGKRWLWRMNAGSAR